MVVPQPLSDSDALVVYVADSDTLTLALPVEEAEGDKVPDVLEDPDALTDAVDDTQAVGVTDGEPLSVV